MMPFRLMKSQLALLPLLPSKKNPAVMRHQQFETRGDVEKRQRAEARARYEAEMQRYREARTARIAKLRPHLDEFARTGKPLELEAGTPDRPKTLVVSKIPRKEGGWRITHFDRSGPSSHTEHDYFDRDDPNRSSVYNQSVLEELAGEHDLTGRAVPGTIDQWSQTPEWAEGMAHVKRIQEMNARSWGAVSRAKAEHAGETLAKATTLEDILGAMLKAEQLGFGFAPVRATPAGGRPSVNRLRAASGGASTRGAEPARGAAATPELPGLRHDVQRPGSRGGTYWLDEEGKVRYGPRPEATPAPVGKDAWDVLEALAHQAKIAKEKQAADAAAAAKVTAHVSITDSHGGELFGYVAATRGDGTTVGKLDFSQIHGVVDVKMVEVPEAYRRQGIAMEMLRTLQAEFPDKEIDLGMTVSDEGEALAEAWATHDRRQIEWEFTKKFRTHALEELKAQGFQLVRLHESDPHAETLLGDRGSQVPAWIRGHGFGVTHPDVVGAWQQRRDEARERVGRLSADTRTPEQRVGKWTINRLTGRKSWWYQQRGFTGSGREDGVIGGYKTKAEALRDAEANGRQAYENAVNRLAETELGLRAARSMFKTPGDIYREARETYEQAAAFYRSLGRDVPGEQRDEARRRANEALADYMAIGGTGDDLRDEEEIAAEQAEKERQQRADPRRAAKLRAAADAMQASIDYDYNPGIAHQNVTRRRASIAGGMFERAQRAEKIQTVLRNLADQVEDGTAHPLLANVNTRADVERLLSKWSSFSDAPHAHHEHVKDVVEYLDLADLRKRAEVPAKELDAWRDMLRAARERHLAGGLEDAEGRGRWHIAFTPDEAHAYTRAVRLLQKIRPYTRPPKGTWDQSGRIFMQYDHALSGVRHFKRDTQMGIASAEQLAEAKAEMQKLVGPQKLDPRAQIKKLERELLGVKYPGYFPTPRTLGDVVVEHAQIEPGMTVWEPSAGKGDLVEAIQAAHPDATVTATELVPKLREILEAKGITVAGTDTFQHHGQYDRIVMNPPFENGADMDHVRHVFEHNLKPGGRLVAIVSEGPFFRQDRKATDFRAWLDEQGGISEKNPEGSFSKNQTTDRITGVNTRTIVVDKAAAPKPADRYETGVIYETTTGDYRNRIHYARRDDGQWFRRFQERDPRYGYKWGAWSESGSPPDDRHVGREDAGGGKTTRPRLPGGTFAKARLFVRGLLAKATQLSFLPLLASKKNPHVRRHQRIDTPAPRLFTVAMPQFGPPAGFKDAQQWIETDLVPSAQAHQTEPTAAAARAAERRQTRRERLLAWFGASRVRNEDGTPKETWQLGELKPAPPQPRVVYHGSPAAKQIASFDSSKNDPEALYGPGFYFTESERVARGYAWKAGSRHLHDDTLKRLATFTRNHLPEGIKLERTRSRRFSAFRGPRWDVFYHFRDADGRAPAAMHADDWPAFSSAMGGSDADPLRVPRILGWNDTVTGEWLRLCAEVDWKPNAEADVIPCYLKIEKPFDGDKGRIPAMQLPEAYRANDSRLTEGTELSYEDLESVVALKRRRDMPEHPDMTGWSPDAKQAWYERNQFPAEEAIKAEVNGLLRSFGYDGITHIGGIITGQLEKHRVWIAFEPTQIKATDNVGTFDPTDPDIRKAELATQECTILKAMLEAEDGDTTGLSATEAATQLMAVRMAQQALLAKSRALEATRAVGGLSIAIENLPGSVRTWKRQDGVEGRTVMKHAYGYVRRTLGTDGDHVDCFLGPLAETGEVEDTTVYVITITHPPDFVHVDEQKCMIGWRSKEAAVRAFLRNYNGEERFIHQIDALPWAEFKRHALITPMEGGSFIRGEVLAKGKHDDLPLVPSKKNPKVRRRMRLVMGPGVHPTATSAFGRWFAGSHVIDADGRPLRVFHGTPSRGSESNNKYIRSEQADTEYPVFSEFATDRSGITDAGWLGQGAYFTPDPDYAYEFGDRIMPVYLALKNPFIVLDDASNGQRNTFRFLQSIQHLPGLPEELKLDTSPLAPTGPHEDYKGETYMRHFVPAEVHESQRTPEKQWTILESSSPTGYPGTIAGYGATIEGAWWATREKQRGNWTPGKFLLRIISRDIGADRFTQMLKDAGYDGVMEYRDWDDGPKLSELVAFYPTQIKSALGNRGTFDPRDPDITKAVGYHTFAHLPLLPSRRNPKVKRHQHLETQLALDKETPWTHEEPSTGSNAPGTTPAGAWWRPSRPTPSGSTKPSTTRKVDSYGPGRSPAPPLALFPNFGATSKRTATADGRWLYGGIDPMAHGLPRNPSEWTFYANGAPGGRDWAAGVRYCRALEAAHGLRVRVARAPAARRTSLYDLIAVNEALAAMPIAAFRQLATPSGEGLEVRITARPRLIRQGGKTFSEEGTFNARDLVLTLRGKTPPNTNEAAHMLGVRMTAAHEAGHALYDMLNRLATSDPGSGAGDVIDRFVAASGSEGPCTAYASSHRLGDRRDVWQMGERTRELPFWLSENFAEMATALAADDPQQREEAWTAMGKHETRKAFEGAVEFAEGLRDHPGSTARVFGTVARRYVPAPMRRPMRLFFAKAHVHAYTRQGRNGPVQVAEHDDKRQGAQAYVPHPRAPGMPQMPTMRPPAMPQAGLAPQRPPGAQAGPQGAAPAAAAPAAPQPMHAADIDHQALGEHIASYAPVLARGKSMLKAHFPGVPVGGRLKETPSLATKIMSKRAGNPEKGIAPRPDYGIDKVEDVAGARMHLKTEAEQRMAVERVRRSFKVRSEEDYLTKPRGGVYRSYHMILEIDGQPIELQIRTAAQTAWADWTHDTIYKEHDGPPPPEAHEYAAAMSAYVKALDNGQDPGEHPECPDAVKTRYGCMVIPDMEEQPVGDSLTPEKKAANKALAAATPAPEKLHEDHGRYFTAPEGSVDLPLHKLRPTKDHAPDSPSIGNAEKLMSLAYQGKQAKRLPTTVRKEKDGTYTLLDGNATYGVAKKHGWKTLRVRPTSDGAH